MTQFKQLGVSVVIIMPYSQEDKLLIKHYRITYRWGSKKILRNFGGGKEWSLGGVQKIIEKVDATVSVERKKGSGRPLSARTQANVEGVEREVYSQEDPDTGEWQKHKSPSAISKSLGISRSSVRRIIVFDLNLKCYRRIKTKNLTIGDKEKSVVRCKRLLRTFTRERLSKTFFSDEKIFTAEGIFNQKNDVVYSQDRKRNIDKKRLHHEKSRFPKAIMVSVAVSMMGKTSLIFVEPGVKITLHTIATTSCQK